jgi:hypothetical protein
MPSPKLALHGENVEAKVFINNVPQRDASVLIKSLEVTQDAVMHQDDYLGQSRSRNDKQLKGYGFNLEMDTADNALMDALIAVDAAREANQPIPDVTISFSMTDRNTGTISSYFLTEMAAKFDVGFGGRTEKVSTKVEGNASYLNKAV